MRAVSYLVAVLRGVAERVDLFGDTQEVIEFALTCPAIFISCADRQAFAVVLHLLLTEHRVSYDSAAIHWVVANLCLFAACIRIQHEIADLVVSHVASMA